MTARAASPLPLTAAAVLAASSKTSPHRLGRIFKGISTCGPLFIRTVTPVWRSCRCAFAASMLHVRILLSIVRESGLAVGSSLTHACRALTACTAHAGDTLESACVALHSSGNFCLKSFPSGLANHSYRLTISPVLGRPTLAPEAYSAAIRTTCSIPLLEIYTRYWVRAFWGFALVALPDLYPLPLLGTAERDLVLHVADCPINMFLFITLGIYNSANDLHLLANAGGTARARPIRRCISPI